MKVNRSKIGCSLIHKEYVKTKKQNNKQREDDYVLSLIHIHNIQTILDFERYYYLLPKGYSKFQAIMMLMKSKKINI